MRKFFTMLLLAPAIALPATFAEVADVPGFYQVAGDYVTFRKKEVTRFYIKVANGLTYGED